MKKDERFRKFIYEELFKKAEITLKETVNKAFYEKKVMSRILSLIYNNYE